MPARAAGASGAKNWKEKGGRQKREGKAQQARGSAGDSGSVWNATGMLNSMEVYSYVAAVKAAWCVSVSGACLGGGRQQHAMWCQCSRQQGAAAKWVAEVQSTLVLLPQQSCLCV